MTVIEFIYCLGVYFGYCAGGLITAYVVVRGWHKDIGFTTRILRELFPDTRYEFKLTQPLKFTIAGIASLWPIYLAHIVIPYMILVPSRGLLERFYRGRELL